MPYERNPYLKISQRFDVPYGTVLILADIVARSIEHGYNLIHEPLLNAHEERVMFDMWRRIEESRDALVRYSEMANQMAQAHMYFLEQRMGLRNMDGIEITFGDHHVAADHVS